MEISERVSKRFWAKVNKAGPVQPHMNTNCWLWTGYTNNGRGQFRPQGRNGSQKYAHRVSYVLAYGSIPDNREIIQDCGDRLCVRPEHLSLATRSRQCTVINLSHPGRIPRKTVDPYKAFSNHIRKDGDCWLWQLTTLYFQASKKQISAKKFALSLRAECDHTSHAISIGHTCNRPICVNPEHLICRKCVADQEKAEREARRPVKLTDEEKAERNRQHNKVYYLKNREAEISRKLAYAKTPAGKASRARSRHKKITEDPERYRADQRTRRHNARFKKLGLPGIHTTDEWYAVVAAQDGKCNHCGEKKELTRDHIVPPSNGGSNWIENIQGLCWECNTAKGEMPWEEFHGLGPLFSD